MPTHRVDIETPVGAGRDSHGDPTEGWDTLHAAVPATMTERRSHIWDPTEGRVAAVTWHDGLLPGNIYIPDGARLRDLDTGRLFHVDHQPAHRTYPGVPADQRVKLYDPS